MTGKEVAVYIAANPSHLEAVDGVLEGIVRAKQDRTGDGRFGVLPILVHGDASMAGQGVVYEQLQMSQLRAYKTGGTIHVVINNQVGFTTPPTEARTSVYSSDVAKTIQAPVFHVNGDDPEAVVRVAEHAFAYREKFKRDVVIDLVLLPPPRSQRGRRPVDDAAAHDDAHRSQAQRPHALHRGARRVARHHAGRVRGRAQGLPGPPGARLRRDARGPDRVDPRRRRRPAPVADLERPDAQQDDRASEPESTGIAVGVVEQIGAAHDNLPEGFTVHPKLRQLLAKRVEMSRAGQIDWGFGELLASGHCSPRAPRCDSSGRTRAAAPSSPATRSSTTARTGRSGCRSRTSPRTRRSFWIYDSLLSEYARTRVRVRLLGGAPDALVLGRPSSATS